MSYKIGLLITAGGSSSRFGRNKLLEKVNGKEIILHTLDAFNCLDVVQTVITTGSELRAFLEPIAFERGIKLVEGGDTRQASVFKGLKAFDSLPDYVIIHDGARPLVSREVIDECVATALKTDAAVAAVKVKDTIKIAYENGLVVSTPERKNMYFVQTPQVFLYTLILKAHKVFAGESFTDDAGLLENFGYDVYLSKGDYSNIKITTPEDLDVIKLRLEGKK